MKQLKNPRIMLITSMAIFGTIGLFVRNVPLASGEIALYRAVLAAMLIGAYLLVTKQKIEITKIKKELPLLIFSGIAMGFNWILLFEAYNYTTVSVATLSYYFAPVIVTAVCPILFREKLTAKQIICFVMSTVGLVLITGLGELSSGSSHFVGILFGLGAAVLYAAVVLINKFIKGVDGIHRTFLQFVAAIIVLLPYVLATGGVNLGTLNGRGWIFLLVIGLIHTGVTYCLYFTALKDIPGQKAAILSYIDPLVAVVISVTILGESMTLWQAVGGVLILGFTLWNEIAPKENIRTTISIERGNKMKTTTQKIVISSMLAALVCVATMIIKIPSPLKGYLNLGDCVVLLSGWILSPMYGFLAAGIGSALADLFAGYVTYVPATFVIKGLMAIIAYYGFKTLHNKIGNLPSRALSGIVSEITMVLGYFVFEGFLYGFIPSAVNIPANAMQGIAGLILGIALIKIFEKNKILQ